jgi:threonine/homoserine/homoserine lactone efflux protein
MPTVDALPPLLVLAIVHLFAVMSPGPSFVAVSRIALSSGRPAGLSAALACGLGVLPWAIGAAAGLALLFQQVPLLYARLKLFGGLYLIYVAFQVWRRAAEPLPTTESGDRQSAAQAFISTLLLQVSNPKVAVFFGSIFVAVLPDNPPLSLLAAILAIVLINEIGWYVLVALVFSARGPRRVYARFKPSLDRVMAALLGALGVRLVLDARLANAS